METQDFAIPVSLPSGMLTTDGTNIKLLMDQNDNDNVALENISLEEDVVKLAKARREIRNNISKQSVINFHLKQHISNYDTYIGLLVRHNLCLKDAADRLDRLDAVEPRYLGPLINDIKEKHFSNLLHLLQTTPFYIACLTRLVSLMEIDNLLHFVMFTLFGNQNNSREEHLLLLVFEDKKVLNLLLMLMPVYNLQKAFKLEFEEAEEWGSLLRANNALSRMMTTYTKRKLGKDYLISTLAQVMNDVISDPDLDLEIDPLKIYKTLEIAENLVSTEEALSSEEVASRARKNIFASIDRIPYGIRWLCKSIKYSIKENFPSASPQIITSLIGSFFFLRFVNPAVVTPKAYGITTEPISPKTTRNLTLIAKILKCLVHATTVKESCMYPLQSFIDQHHDPLKVFLDQLCDVRNFHDNIEMEQYLSLSQDIIVNIRLSELYDLHNLLISYRSNLMDGANDRLGCILTDLGSASKLDPTNDEIISIKLSSRWEPFTDIKRITKMYSENDIKNFGIAKEKLKDVLLKFFTEVPESFNKSTLEDAIYTVINSKIPDMAQLASPLLEDIHRSRQEHIEHPLYSNQYFHQIKEELKVMLLQEQCVDFEVTILRDVYQSLCEHGSFLKEQLNSYKEYLQNTRKAVVSKFNPYGKDENYQNENYISPYRCSHLQLLKYRIIVDIAHEDIKNNGSDLWYLFSSPSPGHFIITLLDEAQSKNLIQISVTLEELLELLYIRNSGTADILVIRIQI
ncbi:GTPase-activating protein [Trichoplax sp. H2]|nr:GTPase-activating protein [Trichoplax sp. H2]|eukprot:RDD46062.1 GTPase-activating protein [Trichoplax sp. H2]